MRSGACQVKRNGLMSKMNEMYQLISVTERTERSAFYGKEETGQWREDKMVHRKWEKKGHGCWKEVQTVPWGIHDWMHEKLGHSLTERIRCRNVGEGHVSEQNKGLNIKRKEVPWYPATTIQLRRNMNVHGNFRSWQRREEGEDGKLGDIIGGKEDGFMAGREEGWQHQAGQRRVNQ